MVTSRQSIPPVSKRAELSVFLITTVGANAKKCLIFLLKSVFLQKQANATNAPLNKKVKYFYFLYI